MLLERGVIEVPGRSQFGAVMHRTTELFLKLFELASLPEIEGFDPSPEVEQELLRARRDEGGRRRDHHEGPTPARTWPATQRSARPLEIGPAREPAA
jgi:hypothetical protein